ncbi:MAG: hypothetical protein R3D80_15710 [Paracoccaceae bacterium]
MIQLAARMQEALTDPISLDGTRVLITASVGFALPSRVPDATGEAFWPPPKARSRKRAMPAPARCGPLPAACGRGSRCPTT